ncbi:MAG TPA: hypothetical protein VHX59_05640 [Mycobacteriales bacterium]|nr:hypothetical protein [Mycobacteriales bacterium]
MLLPAAALHAVAVAALIWVARLQPIRDGYLIGCALVVGVGMPPISGTIKSAWSELVDRDHLHAAYTVESLLQQVFFLSGHCWSPGRPQSPGRHWRSAHPRSC